MKERPILFSGPMVTAILEGRKTQTRRVVKPQPTGWPANGHFLVWKRNPFGDNPMTLTHFVDLSPYGKRGDRLWVRETFRQSPGSLSAHYRSDADEVSGGPWKPSIFMPRNLSRITLEITNVRVERLREISFSDIRAEGKRCPEHDFHSGFCASECAALRGEWVTGWDKINGKRKGCDWNSNPWVWVIEFVRTKSEPRNPAETDAAIDPMVSQKGSNERKGE
jgi:hypothetical protein